LVLGGAREGDQAVKVYLASNYSSHPEMREVRAYLEARGHTVTSRWINGEHELLEGQDVAVSERFAMDDWEDLLAADAMIWFSQQTENRGRGGRHVEFGMALAWGKPIHVVGRKENVFHWLPQVVHHVSTIEAVQALP
jgi:nucleoside 2-deoxyribosyltransferase